MNRIASAFVRWRLAGTLVLALALVAAGVGTASANQSSQFDFTYVYRGYHYFEAGRTYVVETRDLKSRVFWQSPGPDTVLYIVDGNSIVARNDDWNGTPSLVAFTPSVSKYYLVLVRSYSTATIGYFDLYVDNGLVVDDSPFGGARAYAHWKPGECARTYRTSGDPYLYVIQGDYVGGQILMNDDSAGDLNSQVCLSNEAYGLFVVGSYSRYSEGSSRFDLLYHSYHQDPS
jgi:hypothetical protein